MQEKTEKLLIIDANSLIHRAFHALPPLTTKKGEIVNAVYGFLLIFLKAIKDFNPGYVAACFDVPRPTFRHKKYKEYKAKRPAAPKELYEQFPKIKEVLNRFEVAVFEKEGFEADDLIGTIARVAFKKQAGLSLETIILSGDLDTLQLINLKTKVYGLRKGVKDIVLYDEQLVKEKFQGLTPKQILDFKALRGDPSDNIPGVAGIGEKTAIQLLLKFGTLENIYREIKENSENVKALSPRLKELLSQYKDQAFLSKSLAEIEKNVPITFKLANCRWGQYDKEKVISLFEDLGFHSLIARFSEPQKENQSVSKKENLRLW
ncbi:MAG: 5'-3' exonuclease H3TH domain-containing protein [bacterium]|nr:5'-3' exonuclease H3TH domain-containing protein [bacterium]